MRYKITGIQCKEKEVTIRCLDSQEHVMLKISLMPDTLECMDKFIPDSLQTFVELQQASIRKYLFSRNPIQNNHEFLLPTQG